MIDEKFKVRVSIFLRQTLELDAIAFNFHKENGEANLNGFLNKLIPNLLTLKKTRRNEISNYANEYLKQYKININYEKIINGFNNIFEKIYFADNELNDLKQIIWIRPSKNNVAIFDEIIDNETRITNSDVSTYIRSMLNEFSNLPRYKKEQIVFNEECTLALKARDSGKILKFRYQNKIHRVFVFGCVYNYLEEHGNYILCLDLENKIICRYQINEIMALHILEKKYNPSNNILNICNKYMDDCLWLNDTIIEIGGDL